MSSRRLRALGALMWLLQPLYIVSELVVARQARGYTLAGTTISSLATSACDAAMCSPWHATLSVSFAATGALLAAGALLLRPAMPPGPLTDVSVLLWTLAGLGSAVTAFVPLDVYPDLHYAVAAPLFVIQPAALVLLGLALRHRLRPLATYALALGAICAVSTAMLAGPTDDDGLWERLALWPVKISVAVLAVGLLRPGIGRLDRRR